MIKKDCFAYNEKSQECIACKDLKCKDCSFYKTKEGYENEKTNFNRRIRTDKQRLQKI